MVDYKIILIGSIITMLIIFLIVNKKGISKKYKCKFYNSEKIYDIFFNFYTYLNTEFINKVQSDINEINDLVVKLNTKTRTPEADYAYNRLVELYETDDIQSTIFYINNIVNKLKGNKINYTNISKNYKLSKLIIIEILEYYKHDHGDNEAYNFIKKYLNSSQGFNCELPFQVFQYIHNLVKDILYNYRPDKIQQVIDDFDKNRKASDIKYNKIDTKGYTDILAKAAMGMFLAGAVHYCYKNDCDKGKMKKISDGLSSGYEQHKDKLDYGMKIIAGTAAGKMAYDEAKAKKKGNWRRRAQVLRLLRLRWEEFTLRLIPAY